MLIFMDGNKFWESVKSYLTTDLNQQWLSTKVGMPSNSLSTMITRGTMPKADIALKISNALGISLEELLGFERTKKKRALILPSGKETESLEGEPTILVPLAPQKLSAGDGEQYLNQSDSLGYVRVLKRMARGLDKNSLVAAYVKGDSMTGIQMFEDDIVIFAKDYISSNGLYVVALAGEVLVKRIEFNPLEGTVTIISENKMYHNITTTVDNEDFRIWGKVVGWLHVHPY